MSCDEATQALRVSTLNASFIGRGQKGKYKEEVLQELGQFLEIIAKDKDRRDINISSFLHWVKPAILHDQYWLIKNDGDLEPSGYVLWAWVSRRTLNEYFTQERFALHPMCWNEGEHLIVVDFIIADKFSSRTVIRDLYRKVRNKTGISYKSINISIRDKTGSVVKHNRENAYGH
ncbi:toxin-activating lysine-acyltransferase [Photobacterium minamisatsumaniensis]|uniref:toxin-activating lysine-acyltransferase n=1 Tax=Photobacterium minamisatsumaniensis TaxID=2910233 RepID=UPI003D1433A4